MKLLFPLLLNLAAVQAVVRAEGSIRYPLDADISPPIDDKKGTEDDMISDFMVALNQPFQASGEWLQRLLSPDKSNTEVLRIVFTENESDKNDSAPDSKRACLKALEKIHGQDPLDSVTGVSLDLFWSIFRTGTEASCDDLETTDLVRECNVIVESAYVMELVSEGKTDLEVCDIMSVVPDDNRADKLSCKLCKRFVQMVDEAIVQEGQEVQQVRDIIGDLCDAMSPDSKCHSFLKNYDAIVEWLKHDTEPLVVCARIEMCLKKSDNNNEALALDLTLDDPRSTNDKAMVVAGIQENDQSCLLCSHVASVIFHVKNVFPNQLLMMKSVLIAVCETASPESYCELMVAKYDRMVELVQLGRHPLDVCADIEICLKKLEGGAEMVDLTLDSERTCVYCDAATTIVELVMQESPEQIDQIREYADIICGMLGDDSPCHTYVNQMDVVVDHLKKGVHPRDICKTLKYCSGALLDRPFELQMMRTGSHDIAGNEGNYKLAMLKDDDLNPPRHVESCLFCSRVATVINYSNHASSEHLAIVKFIMTSVCAFMPLKFKCDITEKYLNDMVKMDNEGKRPHEICRSLGICGGEHYGEEGASVIAYEMKSVVAASEWPSGNGTQCSYCQLATTVAKIAIQQYGTDVSEIRAYADLICDMLGSDNPCHVYVKEFDYVVDGIAKGMSAKAICVELQFCPALVTQPSSSEKSAFGELLNGPMVLSSDGCSFCTEVANVIELVVVENPSLVAQIRQIADVTCSLLPIDNKCHSFMTQFDAVVDLLKLGELPNVICQNLMNRVADPISTTTKIAGRDVISDQNHNVVKDTCAVCSGLVTELTVAISEQPERVKVIRETAGLICQILPADDKCYADLKIFDSALSDIKSGKQPQAICHLLKYCASTDNSGSLLSSLLDSAGANFLSPTKLSTCRDTTLLLESLISRHDDLAVFKNKTNSICQLIPESSKCELLMNHQDKIIESLEKHESVDAICTRIVEYEHAAGLLEQSSMCVGCLFCEYTADLLKHTMDNEKVVREVKVTLQTLCAVLPPSAHCDALSSKFDELLSRMREGESPSEACHSVDLCDQVLSHSSSGEENLIIHASDHGRQSTGNVMEVQ
ncbi:uncharacterized protein CCR75_007725 [Bremia lactucae]|uniref:Saposin B-type domain-containing protein n=1 Tax=Bremia lactucae TaxID=4779 RepID=A0A976IK75_BRELC|nr:hypothetical protein CCR75_007725 [Bremia lactucae]